MFDKRNDRQESGSNSPDAEQTVSKSKNTALGKSALIGPGIIVNGDISGTENLMIEGRVEGKIQLSGHQVEVGSTGKVHADVAAKFIKIDGELRGDIDGKEKVIISKSGNVQGNIKAPRVQLEDGAIFKGSIDIDPADSAPVDLPLGNQKKSDNVQSLPADKPVKDSGFTAKGG